MLDRLSYYICIKIGYMVFIAKRLFNVLKYESNTFEPYYVYFVKGESYNENKNNFGEYIIINGCIFYIVCNDNFYDRYLYDYFYTVRELRKVKLDILGKSSLIVMGDESRR